MEADPNRALRTRLSADLRDAIQSRDRGHVRAIRDVMSAIDNAEAVPPVTGPYEPSLGVGTTEVSRLSLDRRGIVAVLTREVVERTDAASQYRHIGHTDKAQDLEDEAATIAAYIDLLAEANPPTSS